MATELQVHCACSTRVRRNKKIPVLPVAV